MGNLIEMNNITKTFPGVKAVDDADFNLKDGEIHALIGENGAGKSTLVKMLYGLYAPDSGEIVIDGTSYDSLDPKQAIDLGIGMVHQEFMLVEEMTVLENIILGFEPRKSNNRIDFKAAREKVRHYIEDYGLEIQLDRRVIDISVGEAQRVEIIKTLYRGAEILILDEPTAVLTPQETVQLFEIFRNLKEDGKSIIFISHKLDEIMEISDRVTVMRHGKHIETMNIEDTSEAGIAKLMVGRDVFLDIEREKVKVGETLLSIDNIYVPGDRELSKIRGLSLEVKRGEILGIAGVNGNGQNEIVEAITGLRGVEKGSIKLNGKEIANDTPLSIRKKGLSHIPEDRNRRGLNRLFTIKDNLIANDYKKKEFSRGIILKGKEIDDYAARLVEEFDIRPDDANRSAENLSGGNAQKVVVAREVSVGADFLIANQPTRGVDIGSIEFIRETLNDIKKQGVGILLVSADLGEIMSLSDRIAVMYEGRITGVLDNEDANEENLGLLMTGGSIE